MDPTRKTDIELIKMAEAFLVHSAPIRLSLVFVVNFDLGVDPHEDAGVALSRAFDYIRQEHTFPKALSFVTDVSFACVYLKYSEFHHEFFRQFLIGAYDLIYHQSLFISWIILYQVFICYIGKYM